MNTYTESIRNVYLPPSAIKLMSRSETLLMEVPSVAFNDSAHSAGSYNPQVQLIQRTKIPPPSNCHTSLNKQNHMTYKALKFGQKQCRDLWLEVKVLNSLSESTGITV